jgi:hypothetical protein
LCGKGGVGGSKGARVRGGVGGVGVVKGRCGEGEVYDGEISFSRHFVVVFGFM